MQLLVTPAQDNLDDFSNKDDNEDNFEHSAKDNFEDATKESSVIEGHDDFVPETKEVIDLEIETEKQEDPLLDFKDNLVDMKDTLTDAKQPLIDITEPDNKPVDAFQLSEEVPVKGGVDSLVDFLDSSNDANNEKLIQESDKSLEKPFENNDSSNVPDSSNKRYSSLQNGIIFFTKPHSQTFFKSIYKNEISGIFTNFCVLTKTYIY